MSRLLFDIGANRGLYTDANIDKYDTCILIEANPTLCEFLEDKYKTNSKIQVEHCIVSSTPVDTFYISNADTISTADVDWIKNSRFTKNYNWRPIQGMPTYSIDDLVQKYGTPSFLKIDVEGYEYNVIKSITQKYCPLNFEWAEEKKEELLLTLEYLRTLGYTQFALQEEDGYTYDVPQESWTSFEAFSSFMQTYCVPSRKEKWGMIWAS